MLLLPDVVIAVLATWRVSHMLLFENGPFRVFRRLREALGVVYYFESDDVATYKYEITTCLWCLSVWVGAGIGLLWWLAPQVAFWVCLPYALSAAALWVSRVIGSK